jgi:multidrug efflux pump subunit AcrA (membrane-fusion protein)
MKTNKAGSAHRGPWGKLLVLAGVLGAAAAFYFVGYLPRQRTKQQIDAAAALRRITPPLVNAVPVKRAGSNIELLLPGNVTPITEAYIFARATGFLKARYVDIGDRVRTGQKLADIDAPDLDQQVAQAKAALSQAQGQFGQAQATLVQLIATRDLADITWKRYKVLTATGAVSRQDGDIQSTSFKTSEANVAAQEKTVRAAEEFVRVSQADLNRLLYLQGYKQITAPFDGVITARNVDVGALISATGSSLGPTPFNAAGPSDTPRGGEIFRLAAIQRLRVLITVPQSNSPGIRVGQSAKVTAQQIPDQTFTGSVTRTSSSLDAQSRTLLTEVQVDNPRELLLPGMYTLVSFVTERNNPPFLVPDAALVVRSNGTVLAVLQPLSSAEQAKVQAQGIDAKTLPRVRRVHFQTVDPGRDYGIELEISSGLKVGQEVVVSPSVAVQEGALVQIAASSSDQKTSNSNPMR